MKPVIQLVIPDAATIASIFRRLTPELQRQAIGAATMEAAKLIQRELREAAPRGTGPTLRKRRTKGGQLVTADYGRLRENIKRDRPRKDKTAARVSTGSAFWGRFVEKGWTLTRRLKGGKMKRLKQVPGRPWFDPAVVRVTPVALNYLTVAFAAAVIAAANRLGAARGIKFATRLRG